MALRRRNPQDLTADKRNPNRGFEQLRQAAAAARGSYDRDVWLNLAFYLDEQYVEWMPEARSLRTIPRPEGYENAPRPVVNKIMHFVAQEHATVMQTKPTVDMLPATDDPTDISDSNVALAYTRWLAEPQVTDFESELSDAAMWALVAGTGWLKWIYNPRLKRPDILATSPLDVYVDPYATKYGNARYIIHSQFMDVEQVYDIWGNEVQPEAVEKADMLRTQLLREMGSAPVVEGVTVNELWYRPCRRHPKGIYAVWTGREVLIPPTDFPYAHGRLPFTQLGQIKRPGSIYYASAVKYLRSPQMELNKYHAQKIINRELMANAKWWIPSDLELEQPPNSAPGQILTGNSQGGQLRPELIQGMPFPDNQEGAWLVDEMMNVVGLHEVSQGQVPGRVEAAKAIELLKESDTSRQATLLDTIKLAISEGFWQILMLAKQYVSEEQIVQTYSREGVPEVHRFKAKELKPGMRVRVSMTTGLSRSRAARQEQLMRYWEVGIIRDPEVLAELLEVPVPTLVPARAYDIRLARNENYAIVQDPDKAAGGEGEEGTAITPNSWDDHEIHIREHNNFRKTQEFFQLPTPVKQKFEYHVEQHERLQMDALGKMLQKQQALAALQQQPGAEPAQTQPGQPAGNTPPAAQ